MVLIYLLLKVKEWSQVIYTKDESVILISLLKQVGSHCKWKRVVVNSCSLAVGYPPVPHLRIMIFIFPHAKRVKRINILM